MNLSHIGQYFTANRYGWSTKNRVQQYHFNSDMQKEWAFDLIGKLNLTGKESVLDVGCGDGKLTYLLSRIANEATGIDLSREMVNLATAKYGKFSNLSYHQKDMIQLRKKFDIATLFCCLHLIDDPALFLSSVASRLRSGGKIAFTLPQTDNPYFMEAFRLACRKYSFAPKKPAQKQRLVKSAIGMKELVKEAQLKIINLESVPTSNVFLSFGHFVDWLDATFSENIGLPARLSKRFNYSLARIFVRLDDRALRPDGTVVYNVSRLDGVLEK